MTSLTNIQASSSTSTAINTMFSTSPTQFDATESFQSNQAIADDRALQLALELSMAGLNNYDTLINSSVQPQSYLNRSKQQLYQNFLQQQQIQSQPIQHQPSQTSFSNHQSFDLSALNVISAAVAAAAAAQPNDANSKTNFTSNSSPSSMAVTSNIEERSKKSQNMTECVPVPSSEHVAEIVGRQGCKIKALRAKTNTYIKTPVRNEEPVFVVTGRKEDVAKAKREILSAAEHFSLIRATRKTSLHNSANINNMVIGNNTVDGNNFANNNNGHCRAPPGPPILPGQITIQVRVPYRVVGLVVGPKGATIKHIQQETQTYIVTPSREKEPIFEVTGLPDSVQSARKQIEAHIALRTGALQAVENPEVECKDINDDINSAANIATVHTINTLSQMLNEDINPEFLNSLYKNSIYSTFDYVEGCANDRILLPADNKMHTDAATNSTDPVSNQILSTSLILPTSNVYSKTENTNFVGNLFTSIGGCGVGEVENSHQKPINSNVRHKKPQNDILGDVNCRITSGTINNSTIAVNVATRSCSSASSTASSKSANNSSGSISTNSSRPELLNFWKNLGDSLDADEGIGESPNIWNLTNSKRASTSADVPVKAMGTSPTSISPTDSLLTENATPIVNNCTVKVSNRETASQSPGFQDKSFNGSQQTVCSESPPLYLLKCALCNKKDVIAALMSCGHNICCLECTNVSIPHMCPVCKNNAYQVRMCP